MTPRYQESGESLVCMTPASGTSCNLCHQYLQSLGTKMFSLVIPHVKHFRAMANIKPQSSLTQQQGMQVNLVKHFDFYQLVPYQQPAGCGLDQAQSDAVNPVQKWTG